MKSFLFILMLVTSQMVFGQYVEQSQKSQVDPLVLRQKLESYTKMKRVGGFFLISGSALTATGIVLLAKSYAQPNPEIPIGAIGAGALGVGIPFLTSGTILTIIGAKKSSEYSKKLANIGVSYHQASSSPALLVSVDF